MATRARILADYVSSGVTAAELDQLDTTSGTPGSGNFLRGDKTWQSAGSTSAADLDSGILLDARMPNLTGDVTTVEGAVATTIADNAVTLAKMAGGTDGNLITYDTSGNPAYVATGTSGHVLTSAGADAVPTFQAGAVSIYPAFAYHKNGSTQSVGTGAADAIITFETEQFDTDNTFTSDTTFTPAVAGYYFIQATIQCNLPTGTYWQLRIEVNGSTVNTEANTNATGGTLTMQTSISWVQYLDGDDYLKIFGRQASGGTISTTTGFNNRIAGFKLA